MKALCVSLDENGRDKSYWLTLGRDYLVLAAEMPPRGPARLRVIADDDTPILASASLFAVNAQELPRTWVFAVREGGVVELGPRPWIESGFWERYFDGDEDAVRLFREEVIRIESVQ